MSKAPTLDLARISQECGIALADLERAASAGVLDITPEDAVEHIARWLEDPVAFVQEVFGATPDAWQADALRACVREKRVAMKACKGPGKSTVLAWFGWWCVALHPHGNGFALSITKDNLKDGLWKELSLWYARSPLLQGEFEVTAERIFHREHQRTWWLSARAFSKDADVSQQANTLAGLHARFVYILCDESSDYPDGVLAAAEGIFTTADTEAHLVQAGNPTRTDGPLYNACTRDRSMWFVIEITGDPLDPKRSPRISLEYANALIAQWGRESPVVQVNLLGQFPRVASNKLVGPDDIMHAEKRDAEPAEYALEPVTYALDVARFGADSSVLTCKQGPVLYRTVREWKGLNGPQLAAAVHQAIAEDGRRGRKRPRCIFVDVTGVGASAFDALEALGWHGTVVAVHFAGKADEPERFFNKRAEMWSRASEWVKERGCLPSGSNRLGQELCAPQFFWRNVSGRTVFILESKEELAARGVASPDTADSFVMHFFYDALPPDALEDVYGAAGHAPPGRAVTAHRPFASALADGEGGRAVTRRNPFGGR